MNHKTNIRFDCRYYSGYKPCGKCALCNENCPHYVPVGARVLIIKLAAMGDVLRTTPVLRALRKQDPSCSITWLTDPDAEPLLRNNQMIDRLLIWGFESCLILQAEKFDLVLNFEKEPRALALDSLIRSQEKRGFALHPESNGLFIHNAASEYALRLGIDDELKFRQNQKSMPEILCEMAELPFEGEEYILEPGKESRNFVRHFMEARSIPPDRPIIGLNTGCGGVFPTKQWPRDNFMDLISHLNERVDATLLLLGGPREHELNTSLLELCPPGSVIDTGSKNTMSEFIGIIELCTLIVTADSLALHLAVGLRKPVVALIGPTSATEIDLYGRGEKIVSAMPCAPCYKKECAKHAACMRAIEPERVLEAILKFIPQSHLHP